MSAQGPVFLRWREARPIPLEERFETIDAALDAVEARWPALQHQAPQILDSRRILMFSTAELAGLAEPEEEAPPATG
jgi:hypothetical protein